MFSSNTSQVAAVATQAEAIDFDGTNDNLSRSTDLVGNADGKTFTFSAWVWSGETPSQEIYTVSNGTNRTFYVETSVSSNGLNIVAYNSSATNILLATTSSTARLPINTWIHFLISVDLSSTSNRYVYVNDIAQSVTWTTYTNSNIDFTNTKHEIASFNTSRALSRLSNVYLDYIYRDLSVTANRRLFVTADLKPAAGQAALNPILYLPMSDPTQPGKNMGTGGNFTLTGTVARSGRGPNQYNAPYSDLDGSVDYMLRTSVVGITDSSTFTFACSFVLDVTTNSYIAQCGGNEFAVRVQSGQLRLQCYATGSVLLVSATADITGGFVVGRNYTVTISIDTTNSSKRHIYVNGVAATVTWNTYASGSIYFAQTWRIGCEASTTPAFNGRLGALWFNTGYIDLSVASNLAKFVSGTGIDAKPVDLGANGELPTGTSPLIYLPMYGDNAGKNYGTGGNFTVNSGPYTGARGPNEFWGNFADFNGTTGYLSRTSALSGVSDGKTFTADLFFKTDDIATNGYLLTFSFANGYDLRIGVDSSGYVFIKGDTSAGVEYLRATASTTAMVAGTTYCVQVCIDLNNTANRRIYVNGVSQSVTWTTYTNQNFPWTSIPRATIGALWNGASYTGLYNGKLSEMYFTTEYIDFSQEANRLKFRDAFGNPVNLTQQIEALAIPNPAIYMRFPPTSFGTNSGTGGNFTVNGTITDGGQL